MNNIKTITTIALVNFAVVVGLIYGWNLAATKNEMRVTTTPQASSTVSAPVKNPATSTTVTNTQSTSTNTTGSTGGSTSVTPKPKPPVVTQEPTPPPPVDNRCLVTIQGKVYNVTELRTTHSGGDVFTCGADNTDTFFQQHDQRFLDTVMPAYLAN